MLFAAQKARLFCATVPPGLQKKPAPYAARILTE
jgi:hypothetical protein